MIFSIYLCNTFNFDTVLASAVAYTDNDVGIAPQLIICHTNNVMKETGFVVMPHFLKVPIIPLNFKFYEVSDFFDQFHMGASFT